VNFLDKIKVVKKGGACLKGGKRRRKQGIYNFTLKSIEATYEPEMYTVRNG
jgi:hypothetical protein